MTRVHTVPFHIGDFLSGTMHMDATEIGAYWMLCVAHYQIGEQGLPDDDIKLARIAKVSTKVWKRIKPTIAEKFIIKDSFWRHSKVVDVLRKMTEVRSQNSAKALKRHTPDHATAEPQHSNPKSLIHNPEKDTPSGVSKKPRPSGDDVFFTRFWEAFPRQRRGAKQKAVLAWKQALARAGPEEILLGLERYLQSRDVAEGFAKGAAAWLNDDRWTDEPMEVKTDGRRTQPTQAERADAAAAEALRRLGCPDDENPYATGQAELRRVPSLRQIPGEHHKRSHGLLGSPAAIPGKQDNLCLQNLDE